MLSGRAECHCSRCGADNVNLSRLLDALYFTNRTTGILEGIHHHLITEHYQILWILQDGP